MNHPDPVTTNEQISKRKPRPQTMVEAKIHRHLKTTEDGNFDLDDAYFDRLHDRIMAKVEVTSMEPAKSPVAKFQRYLMTRPWRYILVSKEGMIAFLLLITLTYQISKDVVYDQWMRHQATEQNIVAMALESPDDLHSLAGFQSESDFFVDLADGSMNDFRYDEVRKIPQKKTR